MSDQRAEDLRRCCDALEAENKRLRFALENLLNVREGKGGTAYHADEIARAALAAKEKQL